MTISYEDATAIPEGLEHLVKNVSQAKLIKAIGRLFNYVIRTQKRSLDHLQPVEIYYTNQFMKIDVHSKRNLELTETLRTKEKQDHYYGYWIKQNSYGWSYVKTVDGTSTYSERKS